MRRLSALIVATVFAALLAAGCGGNAVETAPPEGWQSDGQDRWWTAAADTTSAFRDLSTVQTMGVMQGSPVFSTSGAATDDQVIRAAKKRLQKLYRKDPETVDSLFSEYVLPEIGSVPREGDMEAHMAAFGQESHEAITEHFYPPEQTLYLGRDIPIGYPDSLFNKGVGGTVWMQVRVDEEGQAQAIKLLESAHPVLDATARRAATQMRWEPARVRTGSYGWKDIPSWTWVNVRFGQSPG